MIRLYFHIFLSFSITLFLILLEPLAKRFSMETNLFFDFLIHQSERLIIISVAWFLFTVLKLLKHILKSKYDINVEDNLKSRKVHTQINILERVVLSGIIIFAVGMLLLSFDKIREIGVALFASAGVAGIILGLAAQRVVGALLAGLQIAFTQPFRIEDAVIVEGEYGWVEEISLTYVVIRLWDKRRLVLPSTYFLDKPFQNWTRHTAEITGSVFLYTDYHVPFDALRAELTRLLEGSDLWDGQVNVLQVTNAKESNIEIRILVSAKTSPIAWDLRVYIREKMIEFIREHYPDSLPRTRIKLEEEAS